jgi:hypothetical protein
MLGGQIAIAGKEEIWDFLAIAFKKKALAADRPGPQPRISAFS